MSARCHPVNVTAHERYVLALYRAAAPEQRLKVDGLLYGCCLSCEGRDLLTREAVPLLDGLSASHLLKFREAAKATGVLVRR